MNSVLNHGEHKCRNVVKAILIENCSIKVMLLQLMCNKSFGMLTHKRRH